MSPEIATAPATTAARATSWERWWPGLASATLVAATYTAATLAGWPFHLVAVAAIIPTGIAISISDARRRIIPNRLVAAMTIAAALTIALRAYETPAVVLPAVACGALLMGIHGLLLALGGTSAGDVKLAFPLGLALGALPTENIVNWQTLLTATIAAFLISLPHAITAHTRGHQHIPFGPYLIAGTLTAIALSLGTTP